MKRTEATLAALQRDSWICQYHLHVLGVPQGASDGHHMFGRQVDVQDAIIALCHDCHTKLHNGEISKHDVINVQVSRGILTDDDIQRYASAKVRGTKNRRGD